MPQIELEPYGDTGFIARKIGRMGRTSGACIRNWMRRRNILASYTAKTGEFYFYVPSAWDEGDAEKTRERAAAFFHRAVMETM